MPKYQHWLKTRIGTCRSGTSFDIPHDLKNEEIGAFLRSFSVDELVDIFCMTEAMFSRHLDSLEERRDYIFLWEINSHLRAASNTNKLEDELKGLSLLTSPDFVRHGLNLLLG